MPGESRDVLIAIKESSDRTETALNDLAGEIRSMANAITKGFAQVGRGNGEVKTNGAMYGIIIAFATIILALGGVFLQSANNTDVVASLRDGFQQERLMIFRTEVTATLVELDEKLQQEDETVKVNITALEDLVDRRFTDAGLASENRHNSQQRELEEIRSWFGTPAPRRVNGTTQ